MTDSQTERSLIQDAAGGDDAAFEKIAELHRPRLAGVVRKRLGEQLRGQLEVDDVLQETFLRAFRSLARFDLRGEDALFRWLAGIASNVVREAVKTGRTIPVVGNAPDGVDPAVSQFTALRRVERFDRLADAMKSLPDDYQQVIRLTRFEKLPPEEVARRLNRSRQAVRNLLLRALLALKDSFGDTESLHLPPQAFGGEE